MISVKEKNEPSFVGVPLKWISLACLVLQTVGVVLTMRVSRTVKVAGPRYLNTSAVFFSELVKLFCSFMFVCREEEDIWKAVSLVRLNLFEKPTETLKVAVPGLLYTLQNNLLFVSLSNLSSAVYQVTYQMKILTTAVLSVLILGKALGPTKWFSLVLLTVGVSFIQWPREETHGAAVAEAPAAAGNTVVGFVAVLSACCTSGLAGVYLEKILKSGGSIWIRNIQLALFGSVTGLVGAFAQDGDKIMKDGLMQGFSPLVWGVILLQAVGGLVVAAVLKYADNILKCFGNALSIILTSSISVVMLHEFTPDAFFMLGTFLVLTATSVYNLGLPSILHDRLTNPRPHKGEKCPV